MKKFVEDYLPAVLNIVFLAVSAFLMLGVTPPAVIQGEGGWLLVRGIALVWSVVASVGIYTKWKYFGQGIKQLLTDIKNVKNGTVETTKELKGINGYLDGITLLAWTTWWIICVQIMASFFIAEWCISGF